MLKNKLNLLVIGNLFLIILIIGLFTFKVFEPNNRIACVDNNKLFDGFTMTKEMKRIGEKEFNTRKLILDSLYSKLQSPTISEGDKKITMQKFIQTKQELEQFNKNFGAAESAKILSRIHGYVSEFSKENNYQLILGSQNKQTVLFAGAPIDVTNELLTYLNKKYEGLQ